MAKRKRKRPSLNITAERALDEGIKFTKNAVNYRQAGRSRRRCYNCIYFEEGPNRSAVGTCKVVEGQIKGYMISDIFEARPELM